MSTDWWALTWLVIKREIAERSRAKSFWVASVILLLAAAAGAVIPAVLHGHHSTGRVGVLGSLTPGITQTVREAGRLSGTTVAVVSVPGLATAKARLRAGTLDAALIPGREVLIKQQPVFGVSSPGSSLAGALSQIAGLEKAFAAAVATAGASR